MDFEIVCVVCCVLCARVCKWTCVIIDDEAIRMFTCSLTHSHTHSHTSFHMLSYTYLIVSDRTQNSSSQFFSFCCNAVKQKFNFNHRHLRYVYICYWQSNVVWHSAPQPLSLLLWLSVRDKQFDWFALCAYWFLILYFVICKFNNHFQCILYVRVCILYCDEVFVYLLSSLIDSIHSLF